MQPVPSRADEIRVYQFCAGRPVPAKVQLNGDIAK